MTCNRTTNCSGKGNCLPDGSCKCDDGFVSSVRTYAFLLSFKLIQVLIRFRTARSNAHVQSIALKRATAEQTALVHAIGMLLVTSVNTKSVLSAFTARATIPRDSVNANKTTMALIARSSVRLKTLAQIMVFALPPEAALVTRTTTAP